MKNKKLGLGIILVFLFVMALGMTSMAAGNTKTMKNKKWVSGKGAEYLDTDGDGKIDDYKSYDGQQYKIQISGQGYITIDAKLSAIPGRDEYYENLEMDPDKNEASLGLIVLNAKKKALKFFGPNEGNNKYTVAVKKGTYYLEAGGDMAYKLRYTFTPVAKVSKAGKTFAKAATVKKGTTIKNLLFDDANHYKFKLNKKTKVVLSCDSKILGKSGKSELFVNIWTKKGKSYKVVNKKGKIVSGYGAVVKGKKNITYTLPQGTYYLRVASLGSGYYTIKWK